MGRYEDTLFIFTSDNGPETYDRGGAGTPYPYRGWKGGVLEGSHRVAGLMEWPRRIPSNGEVNGLASSLDFAVTFRDLFRQENPNVLLTANDVLRDGISLLPMFSSPQTWQRSEAWAICRPIAYQDFRFCDQFAYTVGKWKIIATRRQSGDYTIKNVQLYDLETDIDEEHNVATQNPEIFNSMIRPAVEWVNNITLSYKEGCPPNPLVHVD